ncbi:MAG: MATE family efflux transporter [Clostridiales bacterium]|nr:MATE family efflux transporter [Clostridiales bacterium]
MKTLTTDFTKGNIPKQLFRFASPLFLSSLLQVIYNMVDMIVVGNVVGDVGLSAVAVGGDISNMLLFLGMGFANAGQVIIAQYLGAGKKKQIGRFIGTMTTVLTIAAIILSVIGIIFCKVFLSWMNTPKEAFEEALAYSNICIIGMVFIYGYNIMSAILRGLGDAKHPFIFVSIASVMNIILDIIFVAVLSMGAGGAALATVISQCISFIFSVIFLYKNRENLGFDIHKKDFLHIDKEMFAALTKLGIPMAIKSASIHFSKLFVNSWINSYGVAVSAFAGVANKVNSISNLLSNALNTAGSSMVGQNIGAKTYKRVPKIALTITAATLTIATIMSILICTFSNQIFGIFSKEEGILIIAKEYLPVAVIIFFASACRAPANAVINGSGNYKINFVTAILDGIILRIGLSVLFGLGLNMEYVGFWLGDALAGFTPMIIGLIFYFSGKWKSVQN